MTQHKAFRLTDDLESGWCPVESPSHMAEAAAELRRLHAENEAFGIHLSERMKDLAEVEAQRDALLEALAWIDRRCPAVFLLQDLHKVHMEAAFDAGVCARAAIKQAEENT